LVLPEDNVQWGEEYDEGRVAVARGAMEELIKGALL